MGTIEERAKEYAEKCHCQNTEWGFIAGAQSEHELLTRWRDPKESVPDHEWAVLVRITTRIYDIGSYSNKMGRWLIGTNSFGRDEVLGWREIHE